MPSYKFTEDWACELGLVGDDYDSDFADAMDNFRTLRQQIDQQAEVRPRTSTCLVCFHPSSLRRTVAAVYAQDRMTDFRLRNILQYAEQQLKWDNLPQGRKVRCCWIVSSPFCTPNTFMRGARIVVIGSHGSRGTTLGSGGHRRCGCPVADRPNGRSNETKTWYKKSVR